MLHQTQETIPAIIRDYPEWHRGRSKYGLWLVELGKSGVAGKVEAAREHLSDFLLKPYRRQPHITLFVCGFLGDAVRFDDDFSAEQLGVQAELLRRADIKPFVVEIRGLNSFASAPFLEVRDVEGGVGRVRELLSTTTREIGRSAFTPHVTVGLYSGVFPSHVLVKKISTFQSKPIRFTVKHLTFAVYEAGEIAGALTRQAEVVLRP